MFHYSVYFTTGQTFSFSGSLHKKRLLCNLVHHGKIYLFRSSEMKINLSFGMLLAKAFYSVSCTCLGIENTPLLISSMGISFLFPAFSSSFKDVDIKINIYSEIILWELQRKGSGQKSRGGRGREMEHLEEYITI